jgi:hypothetical protein
VLVTIKPIFTFTATHAIIGLSCGVIDILVRFVRRARVLLGNHIIEYIIFVLAVCEILAVG